ncbi:hypothetical protein [Aliarcobacter butzleri]|uniref:hypothetical protein n=1 Tax=Aliarcobacter butzleri TaxID=28197 RepID=UPI00125F650B|nr:hypothetical protein [Aliarcobacter butzleri]
MNYLIYKNVEWIYRQGALLPKIAPHEIINLSEIEKKDLLSISKAYFIRYNSSFDDVKSDFWYIIKDSFGGLDELSSKMRNQVKKGKKSYYTKIIDKNFMFEYSYIIYKESSMMYDTFENIMDELEYNNYMKCLKGEYDFWGVFEKDTDNFVAYSQNFIYDGTCFYEEIFSIPESLKKYSSYVLFYDMNEYYLKEKSFKYVHDGSRSLSHYTDIHEFLEKKFNFRKAFAKMEIVYRKDIKVLVKILYPFKNIIKKINLDIFRKVSVLLKHEEIRRSNASL